MKTGRNDQCPCGSGKKFKKCCLKLHKTEKKAKRNGPFIGPGEYTASDGKKFRIYRRERKQTEAEFRRVRKVAMVLAMTGIFAGEGRL